MAASKTNGQAKSARKADWYAVAARSQYISYYTPEKLHNLLNPPVREDGTRKEIILLKAFPKPPEGGCPFTSYKRNGEPVWPHNAYFIMKNGVEVFAPDPEVKKVEVEVKSIAIDGYKPAKASAKKK